MRLWLYATAVAAATATSLSSSASLSLSSSYRNESYSGGCKISVAFTWTYFPYLIMEDSELNGAFKEIIEASTGCQIQFLHYETYEDAISDLESGLIFTSATTSNINAFNYALYRFTVPIRANPAVIVSLASTIAPPTGFFAFTVFSLRELIVILVLSVAVVGVALFTQRVMKVAAGKSAGMIYLIIFAVGHFSGSSMTEIGTSGVFAIYNAAFAGNSMTSPVSPSITSILSKIRSGSTKLLASPGMKFNETEERSLSSVYGLNVSNATAALERICNLDEDVVFLGFMDEIDEARYKRGGCEIRVTFLKKGEQTGVLGLDMAMQTGLENVFLTSKLKTSRRASKKLNNVLLTVGQQMMARWENRMRATRSIVPIPTSSSAVPIQIGAMVVPWSFLILGLSISFLLFLTEHSFNRWKHDVGACARPNPS